MEILDLIQKKQSELFKGKSELALTVKFILKQGKSLLDDSIRRLFISQEKILVENWLILQEIKLVRIYGGYMVVVKWRNTWRYSAN